MHIHPLYKILMKRKYESILWNEWLNNDYVLQVLLLNIERLAGKLTPIIHIDPQESKLILEFKILHSFTRYSFFSNFNDIFVMMISEWFHFCGKKERNEKDRDY